MFASKSKDICDVWEEHVCEVGGLFCVNILSRIQTFLILVFKREIWRYYAVTIFATNLSFTVCFLYSFMVYRIWNCTKNKNFGTQLRPFQHSSSSKLVRVVNLARFSLGTSIISDKAKALSTTKVVHRIPPSA